MEQLGNCMSKINVTTNDLKIEDIQELLILVKKSNLSKDIWDEATQILWKHLNEGLGKLDDQLFCATCFYSVMSSADKEDYYLDKLLHALDLVPSSLQSQNISNEPNQKPSDLRIYEHKENSTFMYFVVSLMYGMFQSPFLIQKRKSPSKTSEVVKKMFDLLLGMGYEYSKHTFIVFKTIKSFKKVCGGPLQTYIYNKENNDKLLALINNNWENPVTGVRDLNREIFQTVLSTLDHETYKRLLTDIDAFYWNKAKYLMLSEIIENNKGNIKSLLTEKWVDGLIHSLNKPGLVSAGADMYYAILKTINNQEDWCQLFLQSVLKKVNNMKAIENFSNYWCKTTMKKFETLPSLLFDELDKLETSEEVLYSKLCVMKQANRLAIFDRNWTKGSDSINYQKVVLSGIEHCNVQLRIAAFDIVCVTQGKYIPTLLEYDLILEYLHNNMNSDSTVLRLNMLGSCNSFLIQLHSNFLNVIIKNGFSEDLKNLLDFCKKLQNLIVYNIRIDGNYQRKITSVKLCNGVLTHLSAVSKKRKDQTRQGSLTLTLFLKEKEHWLLSSELFTAKLISLLQDPADDVRDNVIQILSNRNTNGLGDVIMLDNIITSAKTSMKSKFFYDISCGQSMFKLITNILIKEKNTIQAEYRNVEDVFNFACDEIFSQGVEVNILNTIETGKELHSLIGVLIVVLEECTINHHKINISTSRISELMDVLERVSNQFSWEEGCSYDFSEMNDIVQNIIMNSDYNNVETDDTKISGLQQIVLNCLWLNVKTSCDLASILIQYNQNNSEMCERCLNLITKVLETSRHKGVIEAAGAALGRAIQYLTSSPDKKHQVSCEENMPHSLKEQNEISKLPFKLLKRKLDDLISETNKMSSITRRGAGLSIMVHRIVSSDSKKGKPLFHYFMKTILQVCNSRSHTKESPTIPDNIENQVDLPKAIYIHFMTRIVTDSSLATDMMYYSVELAELAFKNLTSTHWQIRNAALQLYGALIPRLMGQKKASGTDAETTATVALDEMRTHLPQLWTYIMQQLKQNYTKDILQTHSNLLPILSMLANSAKRYNLSTHMKEEPEIDDLFKDLYLLLGSPIYTVRRLTAKTIFNIYQTEYICEGLLKQDISSENLLHGVLMLVNLCYNYNSIIIDKTRENSFQLLRDKFSSILRIGTHSYLCKKIFDDIYVNDFNDEDIENTISELYENRSPGVHIWAEGRLKKHIEKCSWDGIPNFLRMIVQLSEIENFCELILTKLEKDTNIPSNILDEIANVIATHRTLSSSSITWKIMYQISRKINYDLHTESLFQQIKGHVSYSERYIVPLAARYIGKATPESQIQLMEVINSLSDVETVDIDMRYIAAEANNEVAYNIKNLPDSLKVISIKCAVLLLQDEDEEVRNLSVQFYSILCKDKKTLQPYVCIKIILDHGFLCSIFDKQSSIQELFLTLSNNLKSNHNIDEYNPFSNSHKNIYFEPTVLQEFINKLNVNK